MHIIQLSLYVAFGLILWISSTRTKSEIGDDTLLLMYKDGEVSKEKFVYYSIEDEGDLMLTLYSLDGDVDMYIAENSKVPTFEPGKYDLHSATCGEDVIEIPKSLKRPIIVGIYGNSIHETTSYMLKLEVLLHSEKTSYSDFVEPFSNQEEQKTFKGRNDEESSTNKVKTKVKSNKLDIKSLLFGVLEVLASAL